MSRNSFTLIELIIALRQAQGKSLRQAQGKLCHIPFHHNRTSSRSSFTLIELIIVIAILAILISAVVVALNPNELLKQTRDSRRMSDLASLNDAVNYYLANSPTSFSLGSSSVVYVSIPDPAATSTSGTDCTGLGLSSSTLPQGYTYHCAASSTVQNTNGTGWIPVPLSSASAGSSLSVLPLDPTNTSSTFLYFTYSTLNSKWTLKAESLESQKYAPSLQSDGGPSATAFEVGPSLSSAPLVFPDNWVKVPGNSTFGTSDFYVMKYDAKCVGIGDNIPLTSPDTGYHTLANNTTPCTGPSYYVASAPAGFPIANISHTTALSYCSSLGAHLLTNDEYMTIVTNAAAQGSNWYGGTVGTNYMYSGHNDNAPANALTAVSDDTQGYYGTGNSSSSGPSQRRTYTLSNGSVVWDFAGNIWQHVQRSVNNVGDNTTSMVLPTRSDGIANWNWGQYGATTIPTISWSTDVTQAMAAPPNSSWNFSQGMGQVYTYGTGGNQGTSVFIRGAYWALVRLQGRSR